MDRLQSALGVIALLAIAWGLSENRRAVSLRQIGAGLAATFLLAVLLLKVSPVRAAFASARGFVDAIAASTQAGTAFVFGYIGGGALPFEPRTPGSEFVLAFQALPIILVMSVLTSLLYYWGILPPVVRAFGWALEKTLGVGGAVGLSTAANIFVGMVEAPLVIRPYLARLSRSELFIVMTGGMAGIAGTMLVLYATLIGPMVPDAAGHFIIASVLGAPAAILISQVMVPEASQHTARAGARQGKKEDVPDPSEMPAASAMDAVVQGTTSGLALLLNVAAMLIVLVALVHLVNLILGVLPQAGGQPITLERMLGQVMAPICWLMGVPWAEAQAAGSLMGVKTILNEFIAYLQLAALPPETLSPRSERIMLYALCGFANFGSLGILIGGLATMAPSRRDDIVSLGLKSIVSGTLATCLLGAVVGILE
jgi:CNT family concentrative nucleoside transporter